ncbi:MAG: helix-turn-helix domain-containing protein [Bacteroidales bacterium]|nr:helix-turn-helix domain-containing protein [Bacteroidales bacterium]
MSAEPLSQTYNNPLLEFQIFKLNHPPVGEFSKPNKRQWYSFIYVMRGSGVLSIDFEEHLAIQNKLFFIEKYKQWNWIKLDKLTGIMVQFTDTFYNLVYTGNPKIRSDQSLIGEFSPFIKIDNDMAKEWEYILHILLKEFSELKENSKEIICLGLKIMVMMYRRSAFSNGVFFIANQKKLLFNEFRNLLNRRFAELKTPKEFALLLNITPNYLNAVCKEICNKTVSEIIQERVILEAKRLLVHSGLSVSEISYQLGFEDNSYFGRYFKKAVGMPPKKYKVVNYNALNV